MFKSDEYILIYREYWRIQSKHNLKALETAVYFALVELCRSDKSKQPAYSYEFTANNSDLLKMLDIKDIRTVETARKRLQDCGLILYNQFHGKSDVVYKILITHLGSTRNRKLNIEATRYAENAELTNNTSANFAGQSDETPANFAEHNEIFEGSPTNNAEHNESFEGSPANNAGQKTTQNPPKKPQNLAKNSTQLADNQKNSFKKFSDKNRTENSSLATENQTFGGIIGGYCTDRKEKREDKRGCGGKKERERKTTEVRNFAELPEGKEWLELENRWKAYYLETKGKPISRWKLDFFVSDLQEFSKGNAEVAKAIVNRSISKKWENVYPLVSERQKSGKTAENSTTLPDENKHLAASL